MKTSVFNDVYAENSQPIMKEVTGTLLMEAHKYSKKSKL